MLVGTGLLLSAPIYFSPTAMADTASKADSSAKATPTFKTEKPMLDSSTPKVQPPPSAPASTPQQSPSGYFIPPDVMTNGAGNNPNLQGIPPTGYGNPPQNSAPGAQSYPSFPSVPSFPTFPTFPTLPTEGAIPEFGKPLPSFPNQAMSNPNLGPGWGPGPATGPGPSNDEVRVGRLEKAVLGTTYPEHDLIDRVEHLEEEVFKGKGTGDMEARLKKMESTVFGQSAAFGGQSGGPGAGAPMQRPPLQAPPVQSTGMSGQQAMVPPGVQGAPPSPPQSRAPYEMAPYPSPGQGGAPNIYTGMPSGPANNMAPPNQGGYGNPAYGAPGGQGSPPNPSYPNQYGARPVQPGYPNQQPASGYPPYGNAPQGGTYPGQSPPNYPYNPNPPRYGGNPGAMGSAPYAPPGQYPYGAPQGPYGQPPIGGAPSTQYRPQGQPGQQPSQVAAVPPIDPESQKVAGQITADARAGDYFPAIRKFQNGTVARWRHFPVLVHLPPNSPESWRNSLTEDVKKWSAYVPLKTAADYESYVIDVKWENKLPPRVFGIARVEGSGAGLKVVIFLLRPTFYPPDVPETTLHAVFLHELGHGIGLFGHSTDPADVMFYDEKAAKKPTPRVNAVSPRDLNTLKKVYSTPPISDSFVIQPPLEYSTD